MTALTAELHRDAGSIEAIAAAWDAVAEPCGSVFLTPDWTTVWLGHYGGDATPLVVSCRDAGGAVRGVVPLVLHGGRVAFAGANLGDHFQPACAPDDAGAVAAAAAAALASCRREWSSLVLHNVDVDAGWLGTLTGPSGLRLATVADRPRVLPAIDLGGRPWEEYLATRSRNLRGQLGRKLRRLESEHEVVFRTVDDPAAVPAAMARFFELHDLRWRTRGGSSVESARARAFHTELAVACARRGRLRLWLLDVDGTSVAAWYGFALGGRTQYYLAGFDPAWHDESVGLLLLVRTMRGAAEEGHREYDLLLGDEAYKSRFATHERSVCTTVAAPRLSGAITLAALDLGLRRAGRALPGPLQDGVRAVAGGVLERLPTARTR